MILTLRSRALENKRNTFELNFRKRIVISALKTLVNYSIFEATIDIATIYKVQRFFQLGQDCISVAAE
jgi:hypothetical protein